MLKKINSNILIALCTSAALIAFAFDQRHKSPVITMSEVSLFVLAAIICVLPVLYALLRCKAWRNKTSNIS